MNEVFVGQLWHPRPGTAQVNVDLGINSEPNMPPEEVKRLFAKLPGVSHVEMNKVLWAKGAFDVVLSNGGHEELPQALHRQILNACLQIRLAKAEAED